MISTRLNTDIKRIMIHHTETEANIQGVEINDIFIRSQQFGASYDILINHDGRVDLTARWIFGVNPKTYYENVDIQSIVKKYPKHLLSNAGDTGSSNQNDVHIALVGNFDNTAPTNFQLNVLQQVLLVLKSDIPTITNTLYHGDESNITCPGRLFFKKELLNISDAFSKEYLPINPINLIPEKPFVFSSIQDPNIGINKKGGYSELDIRSTIVSKKNVVLENKRTGIIKRNSIVEIKSKGLVNKNIIIDTKSVGSIKTKFIKEIKSTGYTHKNILLHLKSTGLTKKLYIPDSNPINKLSKIKILGKKLTDNKDIFSSKLSYITVTGKYWIGGTGNWSDTAHWSNTSNGMPGATVPMATDDVYINDYSGFKGVGGTLTINTVSSCKNMTTSVGNNFTIVNIGEYLTVTGTRTLESGITLVEYNYDSTRNIYSQIEGAGGVALFGQSFKGNGGYLTSCKFYLGSYFADRYLPWGNVYGMLYAHSGIYGVSSLPVLPELATSIGIPIISFPITRDFIEFTFSPPYYYMEGGVPYCIAIYWGGGTSINYLTGGYHIPSTHSGNAFRGTTVLSDRDRLFYVYGTTP
ncbi:MAG: N-acetylmuramoyl-L-alanine amidase [Candidatus Omnitrophica bacterium]|nr:N-acetylmuramoyl-L-alanine amidase [Candidatus Omnitrophota bacterium]